MNGTESGLYTVEDFLADERKKLNEDRKSLQLVLTILKDEQQLLSNTSDDENIFTRDETIQEVVSPNNVDTSKEYQSYNSQLEKERLAYLFENAPSVLHHRAASKTHCINRRTELNKENRDPRCSSDDGTDLIVDDKVQKMVRMRPSSSAFDSDRSLFGLGEYEERRRIFLEKKKQEYIEYLSNIKKNKMLQRLRRRMDDQNDEYKLQIDQENRSPNSRLHEDAKWDHCCTRIQQENYRKELDKQIEERKKLEEERRNRERLECERSQCRDMKQRQDVMKRIEEDFQRRLKILSDCKCENEVNRRNETDQSSRGYLSPGREDHSARRGNGTTPSHVRLNSIESNNVFTKQTIETCAIENMNAYEKMKKELYKKELAKQMDEKRLAQKKEDDGRKNHEKQQQKNAEVPLYLKNPFMKQNAESWTIDNMEEYQRMKDAVYKKELDKQIEEKREIERKCKARAEEADRKLEERLRRDEERRLKEDDAEKKINVIRNSPRHPQEFHKQEQQDPANSKFPSKSLVKSRSISSADHRINEKTSVKNVSFAPQTYVYSFDSDENSRTIPTPERMLESRNTTRTNTNNSIIIEAPYALAVKNNISNSANVSNNACRKRTKSSVTSESLPIQSNITKPLPEIANLPIPSAVSMSEQAIQEYFKTNAFSDLSKIRRMLRDQKN